MGQVLDIRAAASALWERWRFFREAGVTFGGKRDTFDIFGYPPSVSVAQYRLMHERGGVAAQVVEAYPNATWADGVDIYEDEDPENVTEFEKTLGGLLARSDLDIMGAFRRVDILSRLSLFAVLLIGDGEGDMTKELSKGSPDKLTFLQPFIGGGGPPGNRRSRTTADDVDARIQEFELDAKNPRFGLPKTYTLKRTNVTTPAFQRPVHWSRIIHVAEGTLDDQVFGAPCMERVYNRLLDLEKVTGGGSEAFFQRANQGMQVNLDKDAQLSPESEAKLKDELDEYFNNTSRVLKTRGMDVKMLGSDTANFDGPAGAILKQIAGATGIPMRILTGSEMGTLASEQDTANFNKRVQNRRTAYVTPCIIRRLIDRLIEYEYLPEPKQYNVHWPTEDELNDDEKAGLGVKLAVINKTQGERVFTSDEIREKCFDLKPLDQYDPMPSTAAPAPQDGNPADQQGFPRAAEDAELVDVLEMAIREGNTDVIHAVLGVD